ncbi:MAG: MFS transporter [Candidatus Limnocylindrales bacterium]
MTGGAVGTAAERDPAGRWSQLAILTIGILLAEAPWFTSGAVAPLLAEEWATTGLQLPLLTVAVQLGFAAGAIGLAALGAADVLPGPRLFVVGAIVAAVANIGFATLASDPTSALPFRFLTGMAIAAVYPIAVKLATGWFRRGRGLAVGVIVGGITIGSALPYLFRAIGAYAQLEWRPTVAMASVAALAAAIVVGIGARTGPFDVPAPRFSVSVALSAVREPAVRLADLGYLGHMWELFAMWTWIPLFLLAAFSAGGLDDPAVASLAAFLVVAAGGVGCVVAGVLADRLGRTTITMAAMAASGTCAIVCGLLFGAPAPIVFIVAVVWGITVVADSAQFSSAVSELAPPGTAGSALSLQVAAGFLLTSVTILILGFVDTSDPNAWRVAFAILALGPLVGIGAMWRLRQRPEAVLMASGHR